MRQANPLTLSVIIRNRLKLTLLDEINDDDDDEDEESEALLSLNVAVILDAEKADKDEMSDPDLIEELSMKLSRFLGLAKFSIHFKLIERGLLDSNSPFRLLVLVVPIIE